MKEVYNNAPVELFKKYDAICEALTNKQMDALPMLELELHIANIKEEVNTVHSAMRTYSGLMKVAEFDGDASQAE